MSSPDSYDPEVLYLFGTLAVGIITIAVWFLLKYDNLKKDESSKTDDLNEENMQNFDTGKGWPDNRVLLDSEEMLHPPYKFICRLSIQREENDKEFHYHHGSGFLVKNTQGSLILTCGHNIKPNQEKSKHENKKIAYRIHIDFPGQSRTSVDSENMWFNANKDRDFIDIGAINIETDELSFTNEDGLDVSFGHEFEESVPPEFLLEVAGYPKAKQKTSNWTWLLYLRNKLSLEPQVMAKSEGVLKTNMKDVIAYTCCTDRGNSGSPVIHNNRSNNSFKVIAIHTKGEKIDLNWGVKITANFWNSINEKFRKWRKNTGYAESALRQKLGKWKDVDGPTKEYLDIMFKNNIDYLNRLNTSGNIMSDDDVETIRDELEFINWVVDIAHLIHAEDPSLVRKRDLLRLQSLYRKSESSTPVLESSPHNPTDLVIGGHQ